MLTLRDGAGGVWFRAASTSRVNLADNDRGYAMAPFVPAPGIVSLDAIWQLDNQLVENTFNYHVPGTIDTTTLADMGATYQSWAAAHPSLWGTAVGLVKVYLRDLTTATSASLNYNPTAVVAGSDTGLQLPSNCTYALTRRTGLAGRKNRGRVYHLGMTADFLIAENQIKVTIANSLVTAYEALMTSMASSLAAAQEVILHRALGTGTPVVVYGYSDLFLDSQRRRLPGHNRHH